MNEKFNPEYELESIVDKITLSGALSMLSEISARSWDQMAGRLDTASAAARSKGI